MISYDRYKNKIAKLAAVKNFVVRFRALFISGFALILALIAAFLATKGMVTSDFSLSQADILYGDSYEIRPAKALFSSVSYQFAPEGSEEWSDKLPDKAGKYLARTVTSKAFGTGYGKPLSFEIAPRPTEIAITEDSIVYGDDPDSFTCTLVNGDTLSVVGFRFDSFASDVSNVSANAESVVITNRAGEDVTYCYSLSTPAKQVRLNPKQVSLAPRAAEYTYNGEPLSYESLLDETSQKQLAAGDTVTVTTEIVAKSGETVAAPEHAGDYTVKITDIKVMNGDTDVTALYDWMSATKTAKISVARRAITVNTESETKEYDATPLVNADFTAENLAAMHRFVVRESTARTVVGSSKNEIISFEIQDDRYSSVHDVSENYEVSFVTGTLEVTPRPIVIKTEGAEKAYDGKPLSNEHFTMNPMPVEGHAFAVSGTLPQITETGTLLNEFAVRATDEEGNSVIENYTVGYSYGDLVITEQQLEYTAENITRVYDGTPLFSAGTVTGGLAEGERAEIDAEASAKQTLAGDTENTPVFRIYRIADGRETTHNYVPVLQGERGKLTVQKRSVTVRTGTPESDFEYDGGDHVWDRADIFLTDTEENGLAPNQTYMAVIGADGIIRDAGSKQNQFTVEFYEGETEVTANYEISGYIYGTLTVYKRTLSITTGSKTTEYDGTPMTFTEGWTAPRLAVGHTLRADTAKKIASVTEVLEEPVDNEVTYLVYDEEGKEVTANYEILPYTYGKLNRTPRAVSLATKSASTPYDGKPMQCLEWENVERLLSDLGHKLALDDTKKEQFASITYGYDGEGNMISVQNSLYFAVLDGAGKDISYNYVLTVSYGVLTRSKRPMTLHTLSAQKVYDGYYLYGDDEGEFMTAKPVFDGLVEGEKYETNSCTTVINVKREEREVVSEKNKTVYDYFTGDGSVKTTFNYQVTTVEGDLLITPRSLSIHTSTVTKEYDGEWLYGTQEGAGELGVTVITGFAEGQSAAVIESSVAKIRDVLWTEKDGVKTVDGIENTTQYKVIISETGEDTTDNYDIVTRVNGKLTITPKAMTVTTLSASKTYDAEPLDGSVEGDWQSGKPVFEGLIAGETYKTDVSFTMTDVLRAEDGQEILTSDNQTAYRFFAPLSVGGAVGEPLERETTGNYTITYVYGKLQILPREINVTTAGGTKPYDGTPLTKRAAGDYTADNLVNTEKHTHTLALDTSRESEFGTVTDVEDSPQANTLFVLVKEGDKDVTANYNVSYTYGELKITPRDITVTTASATKEYDGKRLVKRDGFASDWLYTAGGHELVLDMSREAEFGSVINVAEGEADNVLYFKVQLKGGTEEQNARVNKNYNILPPENWGKLKITAKTITVRTENQNWTYDGAEHVWHEKSCDEQAFLDGVLYDEKGETKAKHVLVADTSKEFGKVQYVWDNKEKNNVQYYFVYPENHADPGAENNDFINQNYHIEYVYGNLVIDKRPITITAISAEKTYDGATLYGDKGYGDNTAVEIGGEGYAPTDKEEAKAIADTVTKITDVQFEDGAVTSVENSTQYDIYKGELKTTENYNITLVPGTLKINRRGITLKTLTAEKIYDGTPLDGGYGWGENTEPTLTGTLANGERYEVKKVVDQDGNSVRQSTGIVNVKWEGGEIVSVTNKTEYVILKSDNTDSTANYDITKEYGTLKILQRTIRYTTPTASHEYDGEEFYKYDAGYAVDFVDGESIRTGKGLALPTHKLVPDDNKSNPYSTITNVLVENDAVSSIDNVVYYIVVNEKGEDITANYLIPEEGGRIWGKLTVTPRRLQITTNDHTWVYSDADLFDDGNTPKHLVPNSDTETDSAFAFVSGHTLQTVNKTKVHDVCTDTPNVCTYLVMNGTEDVSYNYSLTVVAGKLTVTKRPITVTSGSDSWVYDGQAHKKLDGFTRTELGNDVGLLEGHAVLVATAEADAPSITHYRENKAENNVLTFKIDKNGTDVTKNYEVTTRYGTIAIKKAEITVVLSPIAERKYNGTATEYPTGADNYEVASSTALVSGERLEVAVFFTSDGEGEQAATPILAGTYYAHLDYGNCRIFAGSEETDATDYEITAQPIQFTISPNGLTVTTKTDSRVYDGNPYTLPEFTDETVAALTAIGHTIKADTTKEIASVTEVSEGEVENTFSYIIYDKDGSDVTTNFQITEVWGKISVTKRTVTVVTASGTHEFDGEAFSYPEWEENPAGLLAGEHGHYLEWDESKTTVSVTTVYDGEKTNEFFVVVKDAEGKDISYNYDIRYQSDGKIKITPRQIEVTVNSKNKTYDGTKLVEKGATAVHLTNGVADGKEALLGGDELVATGDEVSILNAYDNGKGINTYTYLVKNGENDVSENYQIVKTNAGDLTIDPLAVKVTLSSLEDTVYGDAVSVYPTGAKNYKAVSAWLQSQAEILEVSVYYTLNGETVPLGRAGTYQIVLDKEHSKIYRYSDGAVGAELARGIENYTLTQQEATVTIEKRQVELTIKQSASATKVYNGETVGYAALFGEDKCYTAKTLNGKEGEEAFASGETLEVEFIIIGENGHTGLLHADRYSVTFDLDNCTVVKSGDRVEDMSENYTLTATSDIASYEITKRPLTITLRTDKREYDGTVYEYAFKNADEEGYEIQGLIGDTQLFGQFAYTDAEGNPATPKDAGVYTVTFKREAGSWWVNSDNLCETTDYDIQTVHSATVTIEKRKISVKIENWSREYEAKEFSFTDRHYTSLHDGAENENGFVNDEDAGKFSYTFKQGNTEVTPRNVGTYDVTVSFDDSLFTNYQITGNPGGTFTVTPREITVIGLHDSFPYNADKLNADGFSFISTKNGEEGFLENDQDAYTATYTVSYNNTNFEYLTEIIHGGAYAIGVTVSTDNSDIAKNYDISYEEGSFTVSPREISATRDEAFTKVYDKQAIVTDGWNFFDWVGERGETANGFLLDSERANAQPSFEFYPFGGGTEVPEEPVDPEEPIELSDDAPFMPINAGKYGIRIAYFTSKDESGLLERDYIVTGGEEKLEIEEFLLIIVPKDYCGPYTGETITLPEDSVKTLAPNAEGKLVSCTLPAGDSITVEGDSSLDPGTKYVQAVYIKSYTLHGDEGVEGNYRVIYRYDPNNEEDVTTLKKYNAAMKSYFRGNLTCEVRTVEFEQILKNAYHKSVETTGTKYNIPLGDVDFNVIEYANKSENITVTEDKYGLFTGHIAKVTAASVLQYPGVYKQWMTIKIYRTDGDKLIDVTKGYNIKFKDDEDVYIRVKEIEFAFDILADMGALVNENGQKLQNGEAAYYPQEDGTVGVLKSGTHYNITKGKLLSRHKLEFKAVVEDGVLVGLKPSAYTEQSSGAHISQGSYYDTDGASFKYTIYLTANSAKKVFDGEELSCPTATASWLPKGYTFTVSISAALRIAGERENAILSANIFDERGQEASVVSIVKNRGLLTVTQRPLYVTQTPGQIFTYNGLAQSCTEGYQIKATDEVSGLVSGHVITSVKGTEVILPTGSGVRNVLEFLEIKPGASSRTNYASSYKVVYDENTDYGYLNVQRRDVTVSVVGNTFTKEYDGTPLTLDLTAVGILTELGHELQWSAVSIIRPEESREVSFGRETLFISGKEGEVTQYYNILVEGGMTGVLLSVIPRQIELTSADLTKPYDGTPLTGTASLTQGSLASGDSLTVTGSASITNAGSVPYTLSCIITASNGEDITTSCYEVRYVSGTLQVDRKAITVSSATIGALVYGQTPAAPTGAGNYAALSASLASGQSLEVTYYYSTDAAGQTRVAPKNAGTYYAWIESYTVTGGSIDNYEFSCSPSAFTIGKKTLNITLRSGLTKEYDGEEYSYEFAILEGGQLAYEGEEFRGTLLFNGSAQAVNAGSYAITLGVWSVSDESGDATANYAVSVTAGSLEISRRAVTVNLGNIVKEYDGEAFVYTDAWSAENLLAGVSLTADVVCRQNGATVNAVGAGQYGLALENINITGDLADNYTVAVSGNLTITQSIE